jgi:uncharacterized phiE125 gp8 family phage protein
LTAFITSAREYAEAYTGRALSSQTVEAYFKRFPPCGRIDLPLAPLQSVTSVTYKDSAGTETTLTETTDYIVDTDSTIGGIVLPYGGSWPSFTAYPVNPIKIRFVAGYTDVPQSIIQAMHLLIGHWYENREATLVGTISKELEFSVRALLSNYRIRWF